MDIVLLCTEGLSSGNVSYYPLCSLSGSASVLQPKMIADSMGLDSMATLVLIYTGYKLNGMKGMILALLAGVIILSLYRLGLFDRKIKRMSRLLYEYRHCGADCEDDSNAKL